MADVWIKMRPELIREPEVLGIAHELGVSRQHVVGCLLSVWGVGDSHALSRSCPDESGTVEGHLSRYRPEDIDREAGQTGFAAAMQAAGWLVVCADGVSFPGWDAHNSRSAKQRACEQKKKAAQRAAVPIVSRSCPDDNGTKQGTREEKRRVIPETETETETESDHWSEAEEDLTELAAIKVEPLPLGKLDGASVFASLTDDMLRSTQTVVGWFRRQLSATQPILEGTRADLLLAVCCALRATGKGVRSPVGSFVNLVRGRKWKAVSRYRKQAEQAIQEVLQS